jgi:alpha-ribazole phosphatase
MQNVSILLMRHCEPDFPKGRCLGQFDAPLSKAGVAQARTIARQSKQQFQHIKTVFSSDLARAIQTASIVAESLQLKPKTDPRWRELNMGEFSNRDWDEIYATNSFEMARWGERYATEGPPGGESFTGLKTRVLQALEAIPHPNQTLIVAHEGVIRALLSSIQGLTASDAMRVQIAYGEVMEL